MVPSKTLWCTLLALLLVASCNKADFKSTDRKSGGTAETKKPVVPQGNGHDGHDGNDGADGNDSGSGDTDGSDSGSDGADSGSDGADAGSDSSDANGNDVAITDVPGVAVVKVGVNFEDMRASGDQDYNDAVLCFKGNFKVSGSDVVSVKNQQVIGTTSSISACKHKIRVEIIHADGSREQPLQYDSRTFLPVLMNFKIGSKLEVFMTPYEGCDEGLERNMHSPTDAKVLPNVCNTSGG